jgi:alpha-L-fucosidase
MRASFIGPDQSPDFTPFTALIARQSLYDVNQRVGSMTGPHAEERRRAALASARMKFNTPDAAPSDLLNRILWHDARGWDKPFPGVKRSVFFPWPWISPTKTAMTVSRREFALTTLALAGIRLIGTDAPAPFSPLPAPRQLAWHEMEFYGFLHFSINTFTNREWGYGDESPALFNPTDFDADQIVEAAKGGGMKGLILTCKHHDGFCLWPSRYTEHRVTGRDYVKEISTPARAGPKFGVYLSPWDRNHKDYGGPAYLTYYRNQLRELLTQYGPVFEIFFDGANGGDGYYGGAYERREIDNRTYYDWPATWQMVRDLQPETVLFSDAGPDIRWVGNENGIAGETCWATQNSADFAPGRADAARLNRGDRPGTHWVPAECDVSIRPGWFYHKHEDDQVKTSEQLVDLYYKSVGRGASFLLNLPPDRRGRIHENDVASLSGFRRYIDGTFGTNRAANARVSASSARAGFPAANVIDDKRDTYWASEDSATTPSLTLTRSGSHVQCRQAARIPAARPASRGNHRRCLALRTVATLWYGDEYRKLSLDPGFARENGPGARWSVTSRGLPGDLGNRFVFRGLGTPRPTGHIHDCRYVQPRHIHDCRYDGCGSCSGLIYTDMGIYSLYGQSSHHHGRVQCGRRASAPGDSRSPR